MAKAALLGASRAMSAGLVRVDAVQRLSRLGPRRDPFGVASRLPKTSPGSRLPDPALSKLFADKELGGWSLGPLSLEWIRRMIFRYQPKLILEFGSGISTVCAAKFAADANPRAVAPLVLSFEQSADHASETVDLLKRAHLESVARVVVAPLEEQVVEGVETTCYRLPRGVSAGLPPAELVLIDGPAGPDGVRLGTLSLARTLAANRSRFILDDALREGELAIAATWSDWPWVEIEGLIPIEKGLLSGKFMGLA